MKCKKILGLLMVAVLVSSLFAVFGNSPASATDEYVQKIRLEVRMDQSVGVGDTATGVLDAFLQAVEGPIYDGISSEWKGALRVLESYGSYNNMFYNTATTDGYAELDSTGDGNLDYFNPWAIREIRFATNWLINRQFVVEDIYDGFGIAQYSAIGQRNPAWDDEFQPIIDDLGITYAGDFDYASDMITAAMEDAQDHPDLEGALRKTGDFWEYQPPGGDWQVVETEGLIRTEDRRLQIGRWFSERLEECGIRVDRHEADRQLIDLWLWTDAGDLAWGFYTGGWIASAAVAFQHTGLSQMYTHHYPYMPGDAWYFYVAGDASRYAYNRDDPAADEIYDLAYPLMTGLVPDEDSYWQMSADLLHRGVYESVRVFIQTSIDYVPLNREAVTEVATDVVIGWSQILSPRTIKTTDGQLKAAQFSSTGALYMDNWNNIAGFSDYYSVLQARMSRDFATTMDPARGISMGMRAEFEEIVTDYEFDDEGNLTKSIPIPDNVVNYDVFTEEWTEGYGWTYSDDEGTIQTEEYAASAVTYRYHFGNWHSGHEFTMQDLVAIFGFNKQLCWLTDSGRRYYVGAMEASQPYYNNILGIIFDADNDLVTVYGDYTFPSLEQIAGYYAWIPEVPWQLYEAVSQMRVDEDGEMTDLAPDETYLDYSYEWPDQSGVNSVHWLSEDQGVDYSATLANMADAEFVPPYLQAGRNSPIPLTPGDGGDDIQAMRNFYNDYKHFWITHGPFYLTLHDPGNRVIEFTRWQQEDGYPFPDDYWRDRLAIARLTLGSLTIPRQVFQGDAIAMDVRARVLEEYPVMVQRSLRATDTYWVEAALLDEGENVIYSTEDVSLENSFFRVTLPSAETEALEGIYTARIRALIADQLAPAETTASVQILEDDDEFTPPEPIDVPVGVENIELSVSPTSGELSEDTPSLTVTVTVSADNVGEADANLEIHFDGSLWQTLTIPANDTAEDSWTRTFDSAGQYLFQVGAEYEFVTVTQADPPEEPPKENPGFAMILLVVGVALAVLIYHRKKR